MIYQINCQKQSNQRFFTALNGHKVSFSLRSFRGIMYVTIEIDEQVATAGAKAIANAPLLTAEWARIVGGNIYFYCLDDSYPTYEMFDGHTAVLAYEELEP